MKSIVKCKSEPYEGDAPYIFISYCHQNETFVFPLIDRLNLEGYRVWYDNGIHPGDDWPDVIADHLERASACIVCLSGESAKSHNCKNEFAYMINADMSIIPVLIEIFNMTSGMRLQVSATNYINYCKFVDDEEKFYSLLFSQEFLKPCREAVGSLDAAVLQKWRESKEAYLPVEVEKPRIPPIDVGDGGKGRQPLEMPTSDNFDPEPAPEPVPEPAQSGGKEVIDLGGSEVGEINDGPVVICTDEDDGPTVVIEPKEPEEDDPDEGTVVKSRDTSEEEEGDDLDEFTVFVDRKHAPKPIGSILRISTGDVYVLRESENTIGRESLKKTDKKNCALIKIPDGTRTISRLHAEIYLNQEDKKVYIKDCISKNWTTLNGNDLEKGKSEELNDGDVFSLTDEQFVYFQESGTAAYITAPSTGEVIAIGTEPIELGRNANIRAIAHGSVSGKHAEIVKEDNAYMLRDLGSSNGTFVGTENDKRKLSKEEAVVLKNGDSFWIYDTEFIFKTVGCCEEKENA